MSTDYKQTLNLPKTDFPMKASLNMKEPRFLADWQAMALYQKLRQRDKDRALFILHDGPPYANGHIHIGHALNKILKDIIVRYKTMRGFAAPYIPGWDCHGLPVEHQLFKDLKKTKDQIGRLEFRHLAHAYATKYVDIQREEFERLGIIADWQHPYLTLNRDYERSILMSFAKLVRAGFVYRGLKPVNWCYKCETALAEAEVEYADHESDSVFVKFELLANNLLIEPSLKKTSILIWTTTPWTLIANVAVAVHPDLDYIMIARDDEALILAKGLYETGLKEKLALAEYSVINQFKGFQLEGLSYRHPLGLRDGKVVLADYVSKEEGTGCVHTAPGHGAEDFLTGAKYGLDVVMPVDEKGRFDGSAKEFSGLHVFAANEAIIRKLQDIGALLAHVRFAHSYPHCWRCKSPVIFRATQQWFLKIDHHGLREKLLQTIGQDVNWIPPSGKERISSMIENRPDWCLSRQRYWGVPIPALICKSCHTHILEPDLIEALAERVSKEGLDAWFASDVREFLPSQDFKCLHCGAQNFERSAEILDVWFDSGVSHQAVLKDKPGMQFPADLYLEGSDQHRGWFQASLIPSMAIEGVAPYKAVLTHGFVVDGEGRKMSKSLGNVVSPQEIIKDYGADILRLWVLASDYNEDVRISKNILTFTADAYRKIRNTARFILGNLYDYDVNQDAVPKDEMPDIDRWALYRLKHMLEAVTSGYEEYKFYHVFQRMYSFCNEEMSSLYLDILKDRLYTAGKKSSLRRSAQTVLYQVLNVLMRIMAPVAPFTSEEIYLCARKIGHFNEESIHLLPWPVLSEDFVINGENVQGIASVLKFRGVVLKSLEEKRARGDIGSSLEARVILAFKNKQAYDVFSKYADQLPFIFIVSQVDVVYKADMALGEEIVVEPAQGKKCGRCWNYSLDTGNLCQYPDLCGRCVEAVRQGWMAP
ncbi:MAG: isoleucine--tRNA ligase [Candidatus Omnitrophota bacterium]